MFGCGCQNLRTNDRCYSKSECKRLRCFLDRNLPLHRARVIESLHLKLSNSQFKPEDIKLWVVIAVSRCVRKLKISYSCDPEKPKILPTSLYTCKSLVVLKLNDTILLDVPRTVSLVSLKTLQLQSLIYANEGSLQRLLSNCPVLEDLSVELRTYYNMGKFTVIVPSLQSLSLEIPDNCDLDRFLIDTPFLDYFELKDYNEKSHYYLIEDMPKLEEAYVDVCDPDDMKSLIRSIAFVKHLTICSTAMYGEDIVFNQLENLNLCISHEQSSNFLVQLLKDSPNLRVLDIFLMNDHDTDCEFGWNRPNTVPECTLSSLQTFNWWDYLRWIR